MEVVVAAAVVDVVGVGFGGVALPVAAVVVSWTTELEDCPDKSGVKKTIS